MQHSGRGPSEGRDRDERIGRLLAGEEIDSSGLEYGLDSHHLGLIVTGDGAEPLLRQLAKEPGRDLLLRGCGEPWTAWLGGRRPFEAAELGEISAAALDHAHCVAIGEPSDGLAGWRSTHRQAWAGYEFALRHSRPFTRYRDVALIAAVAKDDDLRRILEKRFLAPLQADPQRDLTGTLRAYLDSGGEVSSVAAALGVDRHTVVARIAAIEGLIGRAPRECLAELDLTLRLRELPSHPHTGGGGSSETDSTQPAVSESR